MIIFRKRLFFWLIKAYLRRWGKRIFLFFVIGLLVAFPLLSFMHSWLTKIPLQEKKTIGIVGAYTIATLPPVILKDLSYGLTTVNTANQIVPGAASSWQITNKGKTYIFHLKKGISFSDGTSLRSSNIGYDFSDVSVAYPNPLTIVFTLKESYSPFLATVTHPIFKNGFIGIGDYKIKSLKVNGNFIESLTLVSLKNSNKTKEYLFYPSAKAVKIAYALGEITQGLDLPSSSFLSNDFTHFSNTTVTKKIDMNTLVTIFYDTEDSVLSDKKIREALTYALPDSFSFGIRSYSSFPPNSWAYEDPGILHKHDLTHAKLLLNAAQNSSSGSAKLLFHLSYLPEYRKTAEEVQESWKTLGVDTILTPVSELPSRFQIFLGSFQVPVDPDQYTLWHTNQENNITKLDNKRIDKLLEDGRRTDDIEKRKIIYADFQKYLLDESPASFLYFPYTYDIQRIGF